MKLTAISVLFQGRSETVFVSLPVDPDGKVRVPASVVSDMTARMGARRGDTISVG